ncbi:MAG: hypothetical protein E6Q53_00085 [Candidatus Moraniibacteriota bacterium]|nr:MAG: hypothetical protein E6Q53_00085 [Candidatus Moranbacteria bacterium]
MRSAIKRIGIAVYFWVLMIPVIVSAQMTPPPTGWAAGRDYAKSAGTPDGTIIDIIGATMDWLLALLGFFGIIGFVVSGILYLTAAGNDDQISTAKNAMKYSIIGVIVALLGFVIIKAVETLLIGQSSNF